MGPTFSAAGEREVEAAVGVVVRAFEEVRELPAGWQAGFLDAVADRVMDLGDGLLERVEAESGCRGGG